MGLRPRPLGVVERWTLGIGGVVAFLGGWTALSISGLVSSQFLPSPIEVVARVATLLSEPFAGLTLQEHLLISAERYAYGFSLAAGVGVPLGLFMGWSKWTDSIVSPVFDGLRFIAPIAWIPFAALWFGTGIGGQIMIIFAGAFPASLIGAYRGVKYMDRRLIEAAQMLGTGTFRSITEVVLPASLPSVIAGLRVGAGLGWQSLIGAELIVAAGGVGYMIVQGQSAVSTPTVMAGMLAIGMAGFIIDAALQGLERFVRRGWGSR